MDVVKIDVVAMLQFETLDVDVGHKMIVWMLTWRVRKCVKYLIHCLMKLRLGCLGMMTETWMMTKAWTTMSTENFDIFDHLIRYLVPLKQILILIKLIKFSQ